jgi:hypothetical protein
MQRPSKHLLANGDSNTKLRKSAGAGYITAGLSLSPAQEAGIGNTCPHATPGCRAACLDHQGLASVFATIRAARIAKTQHFYHYRADFLQWLRDDIERFQRKADRQGKQLACRLNVFSDIQWEQFPDIVDRFPDVQFYDYTKNPDRAGLIAPNYWVTLSRAENNQDACLQALRFGKNVSVVFADTSGSFVGKRSKLQTLPKAWNHFPVVDGDTTDLRFDDPRAGRNGTGYVIGLRLKAASHKERQAAIDSGFPVVHGGSV